MINADLIVEIEAIKYLKYLYFTYLDAKDWPRWEALFTVDAELAADDIDGVDGRSTHARRA